VELKLIQEAGSKIKIISYINLYSRRRGDEKIVQNIFIYHIYPGPVLFSICGKVYASKNTL
jgi:hypothetical protein